jgi:hypothetical protein
MDPVTKRIWVGDVGEGAREEIDILQKGKHFGYPWYEGDMGGGGYNATRCNEVTPGSGDCEPPAWDCNHGADCQSITGGTFIDSTLFPASQRGYWFADNAQGSLWFAALNGSRDGITGANVLGHLNTPNNVFPTTVVRGPDGLPYYACINIMGANPPGRIARVAPAGYDGGFGVGGGAGGGGGGGGGMGTGGGSAGSGTGGGGDTAGGCRCGASGAELLFGLLAVVTVLRWRRQPRRQPW